MKFSLLTTLALAAAVSFTACKKDSDDSEPSTGSATIGGQTYNFTATAVVTSTGYFGLTGGKYDQDLTTPYTLTISEGARPTTSGKIAAGVTFSQLDSSKTYLFRASSDSVSRTIENGKIKYSFSNLKETNAIGTVTTGGKTLSGSLMEQ